MPSFKINTKIRVFVTSQQFYTRRTKVKWRSRGPDHAETADRWMPWFCSMRRMSSRPAWLWCGRLHDRYLAHGAVYTPHGLPSLTHTHDSRRTLPSPAPFPRIFPALRYTDRRHTNSSWSTLEVEWMLAMQYALSRVTKWRGAMSSCCTAGSAEPLNNSLRWRWLVPTNIEMRGCALSRVARYLLIDGTWQISAKNVIKSLSDIDCISSGFHISD